MAMKSKEDIRQALECSGRFTKALSEKGHADKSLAQLKEIFDIGSRVTIHRLIHGDNLPSYNVADKICTRLKISVEWYLFGRGTMDGNQLATPDEIALNEQYRNQTKAGKRKIMKTAFMECGDYEVVPTNKADRQSALQLVIKKKSGY